MILAIDPGNIESAYVLMDEQYRPLEFAKVPNEEMLERVSRHDYETLVLEMVASYGMPVGAEIFDTCVWVGRLHERAEAGTCNAVERVYRRDVKLNLCGQARAKDGNVIQALKDRFGGKGTKKAPGWFYGFRADCWQAYALGVTYLDRCREEGHP